MNEIVFDAAGNLVLPDFIAAANPSKEEIGFATKRAAEAILRNPERHQNQFWVLTLIGLATFRAQQGQFVICTDPTSLNATQQA